MRNFVGTKVSITYLGLHAFLLFLFFFSNIVLLYWMRLLFPRRPGIRGNVFQFYLGGIFVYSILYAYATFLARHSTPFDYFET